MEETDLLQAEFTRRQWHQIRRALQTRLNFVKQGVRKGTAEEHDVIMIQALIDEIKKPMENDIL